MRHLCCVKILLLWIGTLCAVYPSLQSKSAMVYYGEDISYSMVGVHDYIIVQPGHVVTAGHGFDLYKKRIYAYVSIGEAEKNSSYYSGLKKEWIKGCNPLWESCILDIGNPEYQQFLFEKVIDSLHHKGFENFFFDTVDSYHAIAKSDTEKERMRQGLIGFIYAFKKRYPQAKLILNRGFEVIDAVHEEIEAVLFESLFYGLDAKNLAYKEVSTKDREWLLAQVKKVQSYYKPVIAVDYLPTDDAKKMKQTVEKMTALGLIPYIADRYLKRYGVSSKQAMKREILLLYDDTEFEGTDHDDKIYSKAFLHLSMPIEYLGYIPVLKPISTWKATKETSSRYAGAIVALSGSYTTKHAKDFEKKMIALYETGMKLLFLETIDKHPYPKLFDRLGIAVKHQDFHAGKDRGEMVYDPKDMGFETNPTPSLTHQRFIATKATPLCTMKRKGKKSMVAALTPWGGYAFEGSFLAAINQQNLWIANPFSLIQKSLRLPQLPIPDVTTENGRRVLFVHIDGDGMMNRVEWNPKRFAGEILYDEIFKRYVLPTTFSIVEGEMAANGLYPKESQALESIARKIYALEGIEAATHTFSHPFVWRDVVNGTLAPQYHLPIPGYHFSVEREIEGSLAYINDRLLPENKHTNVLFWSGDCQPKEEVLAYAYQHGVLQINGGDTTIVNTAPLLSHIAPYGLKRGTYCQVYTGAQNENVYTNNWQGPFWGYKRVIQTFKLTNTPRRLKPIDIYYHIYSGSKRASLNALHKVYQWAVKQETLPLYTSHYIPKVMDFYELSIANGEKSWLIAGARSLKTLRLPKALWVDVENSIGVAGKKVHHEEQYIHLGAQETHLLKLAQEKRDQNYLIDSNGFLVSSPEKERQHLSFKAEVPLEIRYHLAQGCSLEEVPKADIKQQFDQIVIVGYQEIKEANVTLSCQ